jgi:hypothetical protein
MHLRVYLSLVEPAGWCQKYVILRQIVEGQKKSNNVINQYRSLHILATKYY